MFTFVNIKWTYCNASHTKYVVVAHSKNKKKQNEMKFKAEGTKFSKKKHRAYDIPFTCRPKKKKKRKFGRNASGE